MSRTRLIVGCGYLGSRVAALWRTAGDTVYAVTRSPKRAAAFQCDGWEPIVADVLIPESLLDLPAADTVLFAVARGRGSEVPIQRLYVDGLRNVLAALPPPNQRVIYISSTGVYAQDDGGWVDETSPTEPNREGGIASLAAEHALAADARGPSSIVLRMAGLYGPGRVPRREDLLSGCPVADPGDGWLNLIHVADGARVVAAAAEAALTGVVNVSDGHPVPRRDYLREIARLLNAPAPDFAQPSPIAESGRRASSKRVSSRRLVQELGIMLDYPDFRAGLAAILGGDANETSATV